MFEEIAKRIHQVAEAWQYACDAGDFEQANFHRGELSQLIREMKSAQQSVQADVLEWCGCEGYTPTMENGKCSACGKNAHR